MSAAPPRRARVHGLALVVYAIVAVAALIATQLVTSGSSAPPRNGAHAAQAAHDQLAEHVASDVHGPAHQTTVQTPLTTTTTTTSTTTTTQPPPPPTTTTTTQPPPPTTTTTQPPPPPTAPAPASTPAGALPPIGQATASGCAAAVAYDTAYAYPGFSVECPGDAQGRQAMTCINEPGLCPGQQVIVIADACPAAYMNEASNSWVLKGASTGPIDPYGGCG